MSVVVLGHHLMDDACLFCNNEEQHRFSKIIGPANCCVNTCGVRRPWGLIWMKNVSKNLNILQGKLMECFHSYRCCVDCGGQSKVCYLACI